MFCFKCGQKLGASDKFCGSCGLPVTIKIESKENLQNASTDKAALEPQVKNTQSNIEKTVKNFGVVFAICPKCGKDDIYLDCLNCKSSDKFIITDNGAQCTCGHVFSLVDCPYCTTEINKENFFVDKNKEISVQKNEYKNNVFHKLCIMVIIILTLYFTYILFVSIPSNQQNYKNNYDWLVGRWYHKENNGAAYSLILKNDRSAEYTIFFKNWAPEVMNGTYRIEGDYLSITIPSGVHNVEDTEIRLNIDWNKKRFSTDHFTFSKR